MTARRILLRVCAGLLVLVLPFLVLIRSSVDLYLRLGVPLWIALALGAVVTASLLLVYLYRAAGSVSLRGGKAALGAVGVYCLYALLYLGPSHVKEQRVRATYRSLHPILRLATSTLTLFDGGLVVTGTSREKADYAKMGLTTRENSLHFIQETGYAHAIDLRTRDRGFLRVLLMRAYFELLGFSTRRHMGTADHLHVSLRVP